MTALEKYNEILSTFENLMDDDLKAAQYWNENWPALKEAIYELWKEKGRNGKPDPRTISLEEDLILDNYLGDADDAYSNAKMWQERKQFNEDQLNEFVREDEHDRFTINNNRYAIAECIKELEGLDQGLAYADEWKKEEPDSTFPDAVKISLLFFSKKYEQARRIADSYIDRDPGTVDGSDLLFDMCRNVYEEFHDEAYIKKLAEHELLYSQKKQKESKQAIDKIVVGMGITAVSSDMPRGVGMIFEKLLASGRNEELIYRLIGTAVAKYLNKDPDQEPESSRILEALNHVADSALMSDEAQKTGRFNTLEQLIYAEYKGDNPTAEHTLEMIKEECAAKARRLLSPSAFRNLFSSMYDQTITALRKVIENPAAVLSQEEVYLLQTELADCVSVTSEYKVLLADDFVEQFRKLDTPEFNQKRKLNCHVLDCLYMTHHCYGVLKDTELLKMIGQNGTRLTIKDVKKIWQGLPADRKFCRFEGGYVFDEDFAGKKEYMRFYSDCRKKYPLNLPEPDEIDGLYAYGFPYRDPEYRKALEYVLTLSWNSSAMYSMIAQTFIQIIASESLNAAIKAIAENEDIQMNMDPMKMGNIITSLINATRRWDMAGNRPKDLGKLIRNSRS